MENIGRIGIKYCCFVGVFYLMLFDNINLLCVEEKKIFDKHIVGASIGLQGSEDFAGISSEVFYRHSTAPTTMTTNTNTSTSEILSVFYSQFYLSANLEYAYSENDDMIKDGVGIAREDIAIAIGAYYYIKYAKFLNFVVGIEYGALHRREEKTFTESILNTKSNNVKALSSITAGYFIPITKHLQFDLTSKMYTVVRGGATTKINLGLSYSF